MHDVELISRRTLLGKAGAFAGGAAALELITATSPAQAAPVRVRQAVVDGRTNPDLSAYEAAVKVMKALPASDPRSWNSQASIHNNFCPHANYLFLPWHRAYLYYFEQICAKLSGKADFSLPYWNWTSQQTIPAAFWSGALNDSNRAARQSDRTDPEYVGQSIIDGIASTPDFVDVAASDAFSQGGQRTSVAYGTLEGTPHNYIHNFVGGDMGTFMSPLDPIFWLHHANIDRIWNLWRHQSAATYNVSDFWLDFALTQFNTADGASATSTPRQLLDTSKLGYRYDTDPRPLSLVLYAASHKVNVSGLIGQIRVAGSTPLTRGTSATVNLPEPLRAGITALAASIPTGARSPRLRVTLGPTQHPDGPVGIRVFLNVKNPTAGTPLSDPGYVGSVTFFDHMAGAAGHAAMGHAGANFHLDASNAVRALKRAGRFNGEARLDVAFVAVPLIMGRKTQGTLTVESLALELIQ